MNLIYHINKVKNKYDLRYDHLKAEKALKKKRTSGYDKDSQQNS